MYIYRTKYHPLLQLHQADDVRALLRDAMPGVFTHPTPTTDAEKQATKMDVATKGLTVAGKVS